jgi:hypothetical protein
MTTHDLIIIIAVAVFAVVNLGFIVGVICGFYAPRVVADSGEPRSQECRCPQIGGTAVGEIDG